VEAVVELALPEDEPLSAEVDALVVAGLPLSRKSLTYQPEPFN